METKKYKQLTQSQRYTIWASHKKGMTQKEIAELVGCSQSTISRELKRNCTRARGSYHYATAHKYAMERREWTSNNKAYSHRVRDKVYALLRKDWSPKQIQGFLANEEKFYISHQTIYNWIHEDKAKGGDLYKHCRHKLKKRKKWHGRASASHIPNRRSIHERPEIKTDEFGHFEMDTIVAKGGKKAILTIVEKSTNFLFMAKLEHGFKPRELAMEVINLIAPFKSKIKSITTDNGLEFREHQYIHQKIGAPVFFADPYASWQKGAIENMNKLIRQYIPKTSDFTEINKQNIREIRNMINNRPRQKLNFKTPLFSFANHFR